MMTPGGRQSAKAELCPSNTACAAETAVLALANAEFQVSLLIGQAVSAMYHPACPTADSGISPAVRLG